MLSITDSESIREIVEHIPRDAYRDGWHNRSSQAGFLQLAYRMRVKGFSLEEIEEYLKEAYWDVAACYADYPYTERLSE